ncbi:hypothetical protein [Acinetobacter sp. YH12043]|uniref:hypothetical protein n=1 Tax=Acinetobacter sp. YH12043 TaxID=2601050 RepID=UPI0015D1CA2C|nr:hypothetical protein [Acinetobacter sp. YH12043]
MFQNSGRNFGLSRERAKELVEQAQSGVDGKQTKEENAAVAARKRRASDVLSAADTNKKSTLGG